MKKPGKLSFDEVATVPQASIIALQGLRIAGELQAGQRVLINGAGGGSGMFAIQIAKMHGAEVTAVDSGDKLGHMRALGADHVIDYRKLDFTETGERYDLVLDLVGTRSPFANRRALRNSSVNCRIKVCMVEVASENCLRNDHYVARPHENIFFDAPLADKVVDAHAKLLA